MYGSPSRSTMPGDSVVRGRRPGASELAKPGVRANIWPLVPRQKPSPGTTGELCSQPPLGVAETRFPNRSATSRWQVSPGPSAVVARVGSPVAASPAVLARPFDRGPRAGQVGAAQQAPVGPPGDVHDPRLGDEPVDRLGDEPLVPGSPGRLDLALPVGAGGLGFGDEPPVGSGEVGVDEPA